MKTITLCASVSAYAKVIEVMHQLEKLGYQVIVPELALEMEANQDFEPDHYADRFDDKNTEHKYQAMMAHFPNLKKADALLIVNVPKHKTDGYVGPNVLMEMAVGLYLQKPIFLLHQPASYLPSYDEVMGCKPVILNDNMTKLGIMDQ